MTELHEEISHFGGIWSEEWTFIDASDVSKVVLNINTGLLNATRNDPPKFINKTRKEVEDAALHSLLEKLPYFLTRYKSELLKWFGTINPLDVDPEGKIFTPLAKKKFLLYSFSSFEEKVVKYLKIIRKQLTLPVIDRWQDLTKDDLPELHNVMDENLIRLEAYSEPILVRSKDWSVLTIKDFESEIRSFLNGWTFHSAELFDLVSVLDQNHPRAFKKNLVLLKFAKKDIQFFAPLFGSVAFVWTAIISFLEWVDPGSHLAPFWEGLAEIGITSVSLFFFILAPFVMGFIAICCGWILDSFITIMMYLMSEKFRIRVKVKNVFLIKKALGTKETPLTFISEMTRAEFEETKFKPPYILETESQQKEKDPKPTGEKNFCSQCGEKLTVGAKFCSECGAAV